MISLNYFVFGNSNHVTKRHGIGYNIASVIIMVLKLLICVFIIAIMKDEKHDVLRIVLTIITFIVSVYVMISAYPYAAASTLVYDLFLYLIIWFLIMLLFHNGKKDETWFSVIFFLIPFVVFFAAWLFVACDSDVIGYIDENGNFVQTVEGEEYATITSLGDNDKYEVVSKIQLKKIVESDKTKEPVKNDIKI